MEPINLSLAEIFDFPISAGTYHGQRITTLVYVVRRELICVTNQAEPLCEPFEHGLFARTAVLQLHSHCLVQLLSQRHTHTYLPNVPPALYPVLPVPRACLSFTVVTICSGLCLQ